MERDSRQAEIDLWVRAFGSRERMSTDNGRFIPVFVRLWRGIRWECGAKAARLREIVTVRSPRIALE